MFVPYPNSVPDTPESKAKQPFQILGTKDFECKHVAVDPWNRLLVLTGDGYLDVFDVSESPCKVKLQMQIQENVTGPIIIHDSGEGYIGAYGGLVHITITKDSLKRNSYISFNVKGTFTSICFDSRGVIYCSTNQQQKPGEASTIYRIKHLAAWHQHLNVKIYRKGCESYELKMPESIYALIYNYEIGIHNSDCFNAENNIQIDSYSWNERRSGHNFLAHVLCNDASIWWPGKVRLLCDSDNRLFFSTYKTWEVKLKKNHYTIKPVCSSGDGSFLLCNYKDGFIGARKGHVKRNIVEFWHHQSREQRNPELLWWCLSKSPLVCEIRLNEMQVRPFASCCVSRDNKTLYFTGKQDLRVFRIEIGGDMIADEVSTSNDTILDSERSMDSVISWR